MAGNDDQLLQQALKKKPETVDTIGALISSAADKPAPVDGDFLGVSDSASGGILKKLSWSNVKATLKAYFDTLYPNVTISTANGLSLVSQALSLQAATGAVPGALSAADWSTFNAKEPAITVGTTAQYLRGDKSLGTLNQAAVAGLTTFDNVSFGKTTAVGADPAISTGQGIITSQDSTALAAGVGGTFVARGIYTGTTSAGFGGLKWGKSNATAGNLDTYLGVHTRNNAGGILERVRVDKDGFVGINTTAPKSMLHVVGLPVYANNAAAITGGLTAGAFYRTGADPDPVCVVH